jgi:hypothetical protein
VPGEAAVGLSAPDHEVADHGALGLVDDQDLGVAQLHLVQTRGEAEHSAVVERVERGGAADGSVTQRTQRPRSSSVSTSRPHHEQRPGRLESEGGVRSSASLCLGDGPFRRPVAA